MRTPLMRTDKKFMQDLQFISFQRMKEGKDSCRLSTRRLTKAIRNLNDWPQIKERLVIAEIKNDWKAIE